MKAKTFAAVICALSIALVSNTIPGTQSIVEAASTTAAKTISVKDFAGRTLTFQKPVQTVVSLASGDAQLINQLGGKVVGRPNISDKNFNANILKAPVVGSAHAPDYEKITQAKPDLIIANKDLNANNLKALEATGAKVFLAGSNSIADIQKSVTLYGQLLGKSYTANAINESINKKIQAIKIDTTNPKKALMIYGAPGTLLAALPSSLAGDILAKAGAANVAASYPQMKEYAGYAQLSTERIIASNPDVVYLITHGDPEEVKKTFDDEIKKNSAWKNLKAVKNEQIIVLPANLFGTNPGTHIASALDYLVDSLAAVKQP